MKRDETPEERGQRLRDRSDIAKASPGLLAIYRAWWLWALSSAGFLAVAFSDDELDGQARALAGIIGVLIGVASLHLWRSRRTSDSP